MSMTLAMATFAVVLRPIPLYLSLPTHQPYWVDFDASALGASGRVEIAYLMIGPFDLHLTKYTVHIQYQKF